MESEKNPTGAEARLKIADSIFEVIYKVIDKGDGSDSEEFEAKLIAEDVSSAVVNTLIVDISDSLDESGNIVAIVSPEA